MKTRVFSNGTGTITRGTIKHRDTPDEKGVGVLESTEVNRPPGKKDEHDHAAEEAFYQNWWNLDPAVCLGVGLMHVLCILALWPARFAPWPSLFTWSGFWICIGLYVLTGGFGITLCYHRLLTHKSFKTQNWLRTLLTISGTAAFQGGPIRWVSQHRIHHAHSDTEEDPHSPHHGGVGWAHTFWFLFKPQPGEEPDAAAKDLARDPAISLIDELFWVPQTALVLVLFGLGYAYGGIAVACSWVVWGVGVRTTAVYHVTWLVNSAAHTMGYQTYDTGDNSRNTWWVALFSFGEGWHNNHHHKQRSAAHGMKWFELDPTFWMIGLLGFLGLAKDVIMPDGRLIFKSKQNLVQEEIRK